MTSNLDILVVAISPPIKFVSNDKGALEHICESPIFPSKIPCYSVKKRGQCKHMLKFVSSKYTKVVYSSKGIFYYGSFGETVSQYDIKNLLLQLLDFELQGKGYFTPHSSAASNLDKGVLVVGESGAGKTMLIFELLKRGFNFISNERTIISDKEIIGGTSTVIIKPKNLYYFKSMRKKTWGGFEYLELDAQKRSASLNLIVFPNITQAKDLIVDKLDFYSAATRLYNILTETILGLFMISKMKDCGQSLDNMLTKQKRLSTLTSLLNNIPVYYVAGKASNVATELEKLLEEYG